MGKRPMTQRPEPLETAQEGANEQGEGVGSREKQGTIEPENPQGQEQKKTGKGKIFLTLCHPSH